MAQQASQPLPTKEQNLFKQVVKFYEEKKYKKGIKAADAILKKVPEHGETLAMKGLIISNMDRKEEAYELVRRGLKSDLKSHVCWHVYGLLYRADRDYREAIKCYTNALRLDKENAQILRDMALLQVQTRDIAGLVDTRQQLLSIKAGQRANWINFAIAHHLNGAYEVALQVLQGYESTIEGDVLDSEVYEYSELLMYKASILSEAGQHAHALKLLAANEFKIKDRLGLMELQAASHLKLGDNKQAEDIYRRLLSFNPDNYKMHEGLQAAKGLQPGPDGALTPDQRQQLTELYNYLNAQHPHSLACKRIPLDFKQGDRFATAVDSYVRRYLQRGIPALFSYLKPLYQDADKLATIGALFERFLASLRATGELPPVGASAAATAATADSNSSSSSSATAAAPDADSTDASARSSSNSTATPSGSTTAAAPATTPAEASTTSWVQYYLAQHYNYLGLTDRALAAIDAAIAAAPSVVEFHTVRAKILKRAGDLEGSAAEAEAARNLDLNDRYINSMAVKALCRAGHVEAAERTAGLFTRDHETPNANSMYEMQHMWYELATGRAYAARGDAGRALKKFLAVGKHFDDISEDQFDFHSYCVRKMTLRAYIAMLRMEDSLYSHAFFSRAACAAIQVYLDLHDKPSGRGGAAAEEAAMADMSAEERKKYKLKRKKEEKKKRDQEEAAASAAAAAAAAAQLQQQQQQAAKDAANGKDDAKGAKKKPATAAAAKDPDPDGAALAATADPLGEAAKLVARLKVHAAERLETHLYAFEVYSRKRKPLLALSAVQRAVAAAADGAADPRVHLALVRFARQLQQEAPVSPVVKQVVDEAVAGFLGGKDVAQYNAGWTQQHGDASLRHRMAAAEASVAVDASQRSHAAQGVLEYGSRSSDATGFSHSDARAAHELLAGRLADQATAAQWKHRCSELFPWSGYFEGPRRHVPDANGVAKDLGKLKL